MSICVRYARVGDIARMHAIRMAVRENVLSGTIVIDEASYAAYVASGCAWVAERDGTIVGFAAIDAASATVWALFVAPAAEGQGVGRSLHAELLRWAADLGVAKLCLTTAAGTRAERFYAENGWNAVGHDEHGQICFERSPTP